MSIRIGLKAMSKFSAAPPSVSQGQAGLVQRHVRLLNIQGPTRWLLSVRVRDFAFLPWDALFSSNKVVTGGYEELKLNGCYFLGTAIEGG